MEANGGHALSGIKVLDLTHQIAGPSATLVMGIMGADVVKVVPPGARDSYDHLGFYLNNASKRSIALDLKSEADRATLMELAAVADVCVENFAPGVVERLGVTYESLVEVNPDIIFMQIKGFAPDSPYANYPAFDPVAQAYGGSSSIGGLADGTPMRAGADIADTGTGMVAVASILAALFQRERTGKGQHLQVAMTDHVATFLRMHYVWPIGSGIATPRFGNDAPFQQATAPDGLFACRPFGPNDYVHIFAGQDRQWANFIEATGLEELRDDPRFATAKLRGEHRDALNALVAEWTAQYDKITAMETLGSAGVPAGAVRDTAEVLADPSLRERGIFVEVEHPTLGSVPISSWPVSMSASAPVVTAPPQPGEHQAAVEAEWLGR